MNSIEKLYNKIKKIIKFCVEPKYEISANDETKKFCNQMKKLIQSYTQQIMLGFFANDEVIERITQMALFKHLWKSFENDKKLRQTIYSFACEEYVQKGNEYKEPKLLHTDLKSGMEREAVKYESNIKIQNRQARRDGVRYGRLPYKKGNKQEYRFGALCVFKWMSEGYLDYSI